MTTITAHAKDLARDVRVEAKVAAVNERPAIAAMLNEAADMLDTLSDIVEASF
jgi:hypothetical protein